MPTHLLSIGLAVLLATSAIACQSRSDAPATPASDPARQDPAAMQAGRELSQLFLRGDTGTVWARMTPAMQETIGSAAALARFHEKVVGELGSEQVVLDESSSTKSGVRIYMRTSRWSRLATPILMQWAVDDAGKVAGFLVQPKPGAKPQAAPSPYLDYRTKAHLRLPFDGEWHVVWGGHDIEQNYHAAVPGQRFAYDILRVVDGSTHRGDGKALEDYYCWNEKILAPAAGTVLEVVGDLPDQAIGTRNPDAPAGNHVMLDLGDGEYALLAHLRQGSVVVEAGQQVAAGDELGRCGNSGNTSEPHLHFHLQDAPVFGEGDGLPAFFEHYTADGKPVARGEPVQGQTVAPAAPTSP